MNILALDLSLTTGWAARVAEQRSSGVIEFPVLRGEFEGMKYARFNHWLYSKWNETALDMVIYEQAHQRGRYATEVAYGLGTRVKELCARKNIPCKTVHSGTLKKFATGDGHAEKAAMVTCAQVLKRGVTSDDEADALWILEYAICTFEERRKTA